MSKPRDPSINEPPPSAAKLQMSVVERKMAEMERREKAKDAAQTRLEEFSNKFLGEDVSDMEIATIRRRVMNAANDGAFETLVYSFPSDLCTDSGRAITNHEADWPKTLQGKAKQLYERFEEFGKPNGYKLKASIINFPGGMPGDVGFFINWAPNRP